MSEYKTINGTSFNIDTPDIVCEILNRAIQSRKKQRLLFDYGDTKTGKSWGERYDIRGYIGRSTGISKVPLLIHNTRSLGGSSILTHCIIKITDTKSNRVLFQHPTYQPFVESK